MLDIYEMWNDVFNMHNCFVSQGMNVLSFDEIRQFNVNMREMFRMFNGK